MRFATNSRFQMEPMAIILAETKQLLPRKEPQVNNAPEEQTIGSKATKPPLRAVGTPYFKISSKRKAGKLPANLKKIH